MLGDHDFLNELNAIIAADEELKIQKARTDIVAFAETAMVDEMGKNWKVARHHKEWYALLTNDKIKKLQIMSARLHAKTEVLASFLLYAIGQNPNICIKYVCGDDDLAIDIVKKIANNIENNETYKKIFPHIFPAGEWSKHKIFVHRPAAFGIKDATLQAHGVMASGTGGRCHYLILDDIVDSKILREPARIASIQKTIEMDWIHLLWPGGRIFLIGTPWSFEPPDINVQYSWDAEIKLEPFNDLEYLKSISSPKWVLWRGPAIINGSPLWPEKWPLEALEERRISTNNDMFFNQQFMLEGMAGKADWFNEQWIQKCMKHNLTLGEYDPNWKIYVGVDPARSLEKVSSNSVIFTIGIDEHGNRIPIDIWIGKVGPNELALKILEINRRYKPILIMVENNGFQQALIDLVNILGNQEGGIIPPIKGQYTGTQKWSPEKGLPKIGAIMSQGKFWIPMGGEGHHGIEHYCPVCQWVSEMRKFGKERTTTDTLMAMWLADCAAESSTMFYNIDSSSTIIRRRQV